MEEDDVKVKGNRRKVSEEEERAFEHDLSLFLQVLKLRQFFYWRDSYLITKRGIIILFRQIKIYFIPSLTFMYECTLLPSLFLLSTHMSIEMLVTLLEEAMQLKTQIYLSTWIDASVNTG